MKNPRARGAATVELALAMLVLVPVLLYALYAGEAFIASTRAQEAEMMATWNLTAHLGHDYAVGYTGADKADDDGAFGLQRQVTSVTGPRVMKALAGMDSFGRAGSSPAKRRMVVAEQELTDVRCEPVDVRAYAQGRLLTFDGVGAKVRAYLHRGSYMACRAQVEVQSSFLPASLPQAVRGGMSVCGMGRSLSGCRPGQKAPGARDPGFMVLTDDWALEDARESPVTTAEHARNRKYANVGEAVYMNTPTRLHPKDVLTDKAIGTQQVREAMLFLLDTPKDFGNTSEFRFGFLNPSKQMQRFDVDRPGREEMGHLTPWDDDDHRDIAPGSEANRSPHNYLGHEDANYNRP
ncbi:pilus assembly protein [Myxococcus sp. K38C18041901]|uniref:pilus assembly protein n=1 Tax=Myxococcus guangdongensis TaxID=2906760 RepID=UPI0020A74D9E|nr:pilus assembly protein [Myxococcus guangdongensis]MCP3057896.1 pilus assembly protein [Myxococcus guangdongensis]